jgi:L-lactate dehydrogenase complex protein LldG
VSGLDLWTLFTGKAEGVGARVVRAASQAEAAGLLGGTGDVVAATASLAERFPGVAAGLAPIDGHAVQVAALGLFAVAETGSVALNEARLDRGACFLADHLWLLVSATEIVPTLDLAMQRLRELVNGGAHHPLLMTGPSRTADIERILTVGVHGPRELTLLVVSEDA